jgi:hypothetical protein
MPEPGTGTITDTSGIAEGDGHFLHDHPDIMSNPAAKNALAKYESEDKAMMGGVDAMALIGKPHINIPADDADDTAKAEFKAQLAKHNGVPENVEGYEVTRPDGADETNYNFAMEKAYLDHALSTGMNQSQVDGGFEIQRKAVEAAREQRAVADKAVADATVVTLTSDWGGEANYKKNMELSTRCLETFFGAETAKAIDSTGLGNNVEFVKGVLKLAEMAVKQGTSMPSSKATGVQGGGALTYKKMAERQASG